MHGERFPGNEPGAKLCQLPFGFILEMSEQMFRHYELEDRVAQKFQALIIKMMLPGLVSHAWMRERFRQQERVSELIANAVFERIHEAGHPTPRARFFQPG